jgi:hypothetical protein
VTPDYLSERQNAVSQDPAVKAELNTYLQTLVDQFGLTWLESDDGNPVQELWRSTDGMTTNELLNLGRAVQNLSKRDARWTKRQIGHIKSSDQGQRAGAIFEILGLDLFNRPGQEVIPAGDDQEGCDGRIVLSDGSVIVSIKNHGLSSNEAAFLQRADEIHCEFLDRMSQARANELDVRIMAVGQPTAADWSTLRSQMADVVARRKPTDGELWQGSWRLLDPKWRPLSPSHISYSFLLLAPYHKNEQKNFEDKIAAGIANLEKHCSVVPEDVCRMLFLRLSASASLPDCARWAQEYFDLYPDTNVEMIMLYQATIAVDRAKDTSQLSHYGVPVFGPRYQAWRDGGASPRNVLMEALVGKIESRPTRLIMTNGAAEMDMSGRYMFQRSEIYRYYDPQKGQVDAILSNPAPGIFINAVFGDGGALKMKRPPESRLLLLP